MYMITVFTLYVMYKLSMCRKLVFLEKNLIRLIFFIILLLFFYYLAQYFFKTIKILKNNYEIPGQIKNIKFQNQSGKGQELDDRASFAAKAGFYPFRNNFNGLVPYKGNT